MTERMKKALLDLKERQENGTYTLCPRCGRDTMKPDLYTNALSRQADIMVCDACGSEEALLAFMNKPYSLYQWAAFRPVKPASHFKKEQAKRCGRSSATSRPSRFQTCTDASSAGKTRGKFASLPTSSAPA